MCDLCVVEFDYYGEPIPRWHFIKATDDKGFYVKNGEYGLVYDHIPNNPTLSIPDVGLFEDIGFYEIVAKVAEAIECHPTWGYKLYVSCLEGGFVPKEHALTSWLTNRLAEQVAKGPQPITQ